MCLDYSFRSYQSVCLKSIIIIICFIKVSFSSDTIPFMLSRYEKSSLFVTEEPDVKLKKVSC